MPEPTTTTTAVTLATAAALVPPITVMGVSLGLRPDVLMAGFAGAVAGIILLNSVPGSSDTWVELLRTTVNRMFVVLASTLTAGYLTPILATPIGMGQGNTLGTAFVAGAAARLVLRWAVDKITPPHAPPSVPPQGGEDGQP